MQFRNKPINGYWFPFLGWQWWNCEDVDVPELMFSHDKQVRVFVLEWLGSGIVFVLDLDSTRPIQ